MGPTRRFNLHPDLRSNDARLFSKGLSHGGTGAPLVGIFQFCSSHTFFYSFLFACILRIQSPHEDVFIRTPKPPGLTGEPGQEPTCDLHSERRIIRLGVAEWWSGLGEQRWPQPRMRCCSCDCVFFLLPFGAPLSWLCAMSSALQFTSASLCACHRTPSHLNIHLNSVSS